MNINCQSSVYVGRTHLTIGDNTFDSSILQGEIDTLTSNLDIASNSLYNYTTSKFNELWDVNPNNNYGIIKYKEYLTYDESLHYI